MAVSGSVSKRRKVAYFGAVVLAVCALSAVGVSLKLTNRGNKPTGFWYLDLNTGKLFLADTKELPPIPAPSGGLGVRAHVYGCDKGCGRTNLEGMTLLDLEELGLFVSHLERVSDEGITRAKQAKANATDKIKPDAAAYIAIMDDRLVKILNTPDAKWVKSTFETTRIITGMLQSRCGGRQAEPCIPGRD